MRIRQAKLVALVLGCMCTAGLGTTFEWTDGGTGHDWDDEDNWTILLCPVVCYPSTCNDDATFPVSGEAPWTVKLVIDTIDDVTIHDDVDFVAGSGIGLRPVLKVDSLTINGPAMATMDLATIIAENPCP